MLRTLDLFLLTLVRYGLSTPYDWQARAGVSLGASLPAAKRLLAGRQVTETEKGPRGRREFRLTRSGRRVLQNIAQHVEQALDEGPSDLESVLRLACMAISESKIELAKKLLRQSAQEQGKRSRLAGRRISVPPKGTSVADLYVVALAHCDASRLDATSKGLESLITILGLESERTSPVRRDRKSPR